MELEITKLYQADGEDERLILKALADADLGYYLLTDSTFRGNGATSNHFRHVYEFPFHKVKENDLIVLYTRSGKDRVQKNENNSTHFFYWDVESNVWNNDFDSVTLIKMEGWKAKQFKDIHHKPNK